MVIALALVLVLGACAKATPSPAPSPAPAPAPVPAPAPPPSPTAKPTSSPSPTAAPPASGAADFFKNNVVEVVVPYTAGGGTDQAARTFLAAWTEVFGGTARVNNMPGGGTVVGTNYVYKAKPDGKTLYITTFGSALATPMLFGAQGVQFEVSKFSYFGSYADSPPVFGIDKKLPYNTLEEVKKAKGLKLGTVTSVAGMPTSGDVTVIYILGLEDAQVISGFDATPEVGLAISRGEIQGMVFTGDSMLKEAQKGIVKNLAAVATVAHPLVPEAKPIGQILKLTPDQQRMFNLYDAAFKSARVFMGPPGMDPAMVDYLQQGMKKMIATETYKSAAMKVMGFVDEPIIGQDLVKLIQGLAAIPKADVDLMNSLHKKWVK